MGAHAARFNAEAQQWQLDGPRQACSPGLALLWSSADGAGEAQGNEGRRLFYTVVLSLASRKAPFSFWCPSRFFHTPFPHLSLSLSLSPPPKPPRTQDLEDGVAAAEWDLLRQLALEGDSEAPEPLRECAARWLFLFRLQRLCASLCALLCTSLCASLSASLSALFGTSLCSSLCASLPLSHRFPRLPPPRPLSAHGPCQSVGRFLSLLPSGSPAPQREPGSDASALLSGWQQHAEAKVVEREERFDTLDDKFLLFDESSWDGNDGAETGSHFRWLGREAEWKLLAQTEESARKRRQALRRTVSFPDGSQSGDGFFEDRAAGAGRSGTLLRRRSGMLSSASLLSAASDEGGSSVTAGDRAASGGAVPLEERRASFPSSATGAATSRVNALALLAQVTPDALQAVLCGDHGAAEQGARDGAGHMRFEEWRQRSRELMVQAGLGVQAGDGAAGRAEVASEAILQRLQGAPGLELGDFFDRARVEVNADDAGISNPQRWVRGKGGGAWGQRCAHAARQQSLMSCLDMSFRSLLRVRTAGGSLLRRTSTGNLSRSSGTENPPRPASLAMLSCVCVCVCVCVLSLCWFRHLSPRFRGRTSQQAQVSRGALVGGAGGTGRQVTGEQPHSVVPLLGRRRRGEMDDLVRGN